MFSIRPRHIGLLVLALSLLAPPAALPASPPAATPLPPAVGDSPPDAAGAWVEGAALYGAPKYKPGFSHLDYVNPDAPRGGTLYLPNPDRRTSFDKFNPFTTKGSAPAGVTLLMFESLAQSTFDEPASMYGLLASQFRIAPDNTAIEFRLNPAAHFSNGDPVLAEDVKYTFDTLMSPQAFPGWRALFAEVKRVTVLDPRTIRFELSQPDRQLLFSIGTGILIFSHKWGLQPDGKHIPFDQLTHDYPIATGPYLIEKAENGRRIEFKRDPHYWANQHPLARGLFNYDRVVYRFYLDLAVQREAFKAGEFDIVEEYSAKGWIREQTGKKYDEGLIKKAAIPTEDGQPMNGYFMNLRRPLFKDRRVRAAIDLAYDFEHFNNKAFHEYKRQYSLFANTPFAASGLPTPDELKLLEPYRSQLDPAVFGPAWRPPRTDQSPDELRDNLLRARDLLAQAGWKVAPDGVLRNAAGEAFEFEYLEPQKGPEAETLAWQRNLTRLGIKLDLRLVDFAIYQKRLENFDFDMITINPQAQPLPSAQTFQDLFGSENADVKGSNNFCGVKNPVLDALFKKMADARTMDELLAATRAADRVFMHEVYVVPRLYLDHTRLAYWARLGVPAVVPHHGSARDWAIASFWIKPKAGP